MNCPPAANFALALVNYLLADNPGMQVTDVRYIGAPIASDCFQDGVAHWLDIDTGVVLTTGCGIAGVEAYQGSEKSNVS